MYKSKAKIWTFKRINKTLLNILDNSFEIRSEKLKAKVYGITMFLLATKEKPYHYNR